MHRIEHLQMEPKERGICISYLESVKPPGAGEFDEPVPHHKEFVFSDEELDTAMEAFKKLTEFYRSDANKEGKVPPDINS